MDGLGAFQGVILVHFGQLFISSVLYLDTIYLFLYQITYTSDYFQDLYELAVELIRRGHAYVDHQVIMQIVYFFLFHLNCSGSACFLLRYHL